MQLCSKRRGFRWKITIIIVGIIVVYYLLIIIISLVENNLDDESFFFNIFEGKPGDRKYPILVWWTPFTGDPGSLKRCGEHVCFFTDHRKYAEEARAFLFYGSDFRPTDLPLPRRASHEWALLHEESPKNNFLFSTEKVMRLFNHTSTFRRESDLPLTLQYLPGLEALTTRRHLSVHKNAAPLVYLHSDCDTPSQRDAFVEELARHLPVDSYGKCLHNKELPSKLSEPMTNLFSEELYDLLAQYKFSLAIENAVCPDYITEKLWRPLTVGSVPIYFGSPTVRDWLPNPNSAIFVKDFSSPRHLADHLRHLLANDSAYEAHLEHKILGRVSNGRLLRALADRPWGVDNDPGRVSFIDCFECLVCERVSENARREALGLRPVLRSASAAHYGCPRPSGSAALRGGGWWPELFDKAVAEADALEILLDRGGNFSAADFYQEVIALLEGTSLRRTSIKR